MAAPLARKYHSPPSLQRGRDRQTRPRLVLECRLCEFHVIGPSLKCSVSPEGGSGFWGGGGGGGRLMSIRASKGRGPPARCFFFIFFLVAPPSSTYDARAFWRCSAGLMEHPWNAGIVPCSAADLAFAREDAPRVGKLCV